jgi:hypothetical protein
MPVAAGARSSTAVSNSPFAPPTSTIRWKRGYVDRRCRFGRCARRLLTHRPGALLRLLGVVGVVVPPSTAGAVDRPVRTSSPRSPTGWYLLTAVVPGDVGSGGRDGLLGLARPTGWRRRHLWLRVDDQVRHESELEPSAPIIGGGDARRPRLASAALDNGGADMRSSAPGRPPGAGGIGPGPNGHRR